MALQVNQGTVRVQNGQTVVRHQWRLFLTGVTGSFATGDSVNLGGSNLGTCGAWNPATGEFHYVRLLGANPAVGNTVTGPNGSGTVASIGASSPPNWNVTVTPPAVASFAGHHATYDVQSLAQDNFTLATAYVGDSAYDLDYGLNTDLTVLGLGLAKPGDVGAVSIFSRNMTRLTTLLTRAACELRLSSNLALVHSMDAAISWGTEVEDTGGFAVAPTTIMTMPSGISRVDFGAAIRLTAALSDSGHVVTVRLLKNATEITQQSLVAPGVGLSLHRSGLPVIAGDTLSVKIAASDPNTAGLPSVLAGANTNFWARVVEVI